MKILVFSDSHASLQFMRSCLAKIKPDAVIHLGDYFDDGEVIREENPHLVFHQVVGNCDRNRAPVYAREFLAYPVCGVNLFMTHGHNHHVKLGIGALIADARKYNVQAVLYGHTHIADCRQLEDGLWVVNPGSCGCNGRSAAVIEIQGDKISACYLIGQADIL